MFGARIVQTDSQATDGGRGSGRKSSLIRLGSWKLSRRDSASGFVATQFSGFTPKHIVLFCRIIAFLDVLRAVIISYIASEICVSAISGIKSGRRQTAPTPG